MLRNIRAIYEAREGTIRKNYDPNYESGSDEMSSVGSFGSDTSDLNKAKVKTEKDSDPAIPSYKAPSILEKEEYKKL